MQSLHSSICVFALAVSQGLAASPDQRARDESDPVTFAVIGDFGGDNASETAVANLVKNVLDPQFIITVGDNNYGSHSAAGYDAAIGKHYSQYIGNYSGQYGRGSPVNRFWPALGNHDWSDNTGFAAYLNYFTLPGNERYYDVVAGPVHLFVINSDSHEPDGNAADSLQAQWLENTMSASRSPWKLVLLHHAPYSSGVEHGSSVIRQWPFVQWGADGVLAGHDHNYEHLEVAGNPYFVNGLGGKSIYEFDSPISESRFRYNANYGAMKVIAWPDRITYEFWSIAGGAGGTLIDRYTVPAAGPGPALVHAGGAWKYLDNGSNQSTAWQKVNFDDSAWLAGDAQLGYGEGDESTSVNFGPDPNNKFITTYFRKCFVVDDSAAAPSLNLGLLCDDGAVVYLNGVEILRRNLPAAPATITHQTLATSAIGGAGEGTWTSTVLSPCLLRLGNNVLAVEIHQSSAASSDLSFDLSLDPSFDPPPICIDPCPGDLNFSAAADIDDLLLVIQHWGEHRPQGAEADADNNGVVDINDLLDVVSSWGQCP